MGILINEMPIEGCTTVRGLFHLRNSSLIYIYFFGMWIKDMSGVYSVKELVFQLTSALTLYKLRLYPVSSANI